MLTGAWTSQRSKTVSWLVTCLACQSNNLKETRNCFNCICNRNREEIMFRILENISTMKSSTHMQRTHAGISFINDFCLNILIQKKKSLFLLSRKLYCSCTDKHMQFSMHQASQTPLPRLIPKPLWKTFQLSAGNSFPMGTELALLSHTHFNIHHQLGWTELKPEGGFLSSSMIEGLLLPTANVK